MATAREDAPTFSFHPATPERWRDIEALFGPRGACEGCWCMFWRLSRSEWARKRDEGNRLAFKAIVERGEIPGILAYARGEPVGWCSVAPRDVFPSLDRSRTLKRIDSEPVWSVVCFFVAKPSRDKGLMVQLLRAAVDHVRDRGGAVVEGYPVMPRRRIAAADAYTGTASAFLQAGFQEAARRSDYRTIMRYTIVPRPIVSNGR